MRSRGGATPVGRLPDDKDRRRGRPNLTRGRVNGAALPSIPPTPPFRAWPSACLAAWEILPLSDFVR